MMTPHEAERLLGGHAAGILTPDEQAQLYAAALAHQEVFDALADEEALRELLADPAVRARLLAQLAPVKVVPFWRRPAVLGLAASLFLVVTTTLVVNRTPPEKGLERQRRAVPSDAPAAPAQPEAAPRQEQAPQPPVRGLGQPERRLQEPSGDNLGRSQEAPLPKPVPPAAAPAPGAAGWSAGGASGLVSPAPEAQRTAPKLKAADKEEKAPTAPAAKAEVQADQAKLLDMAPNARKRQAALPAPHWQVEALGEGRTRVTVTAATGGSLYLLRRQEGRVEVLVPVRTEQVSDGRSRSTFETVLSSNGSLDLYLLAQPVTDPAALPAAGPVDGFRTRLSIPR